MLVALRLLPVPAAFAGLAALTGPCREGAAGGARVAADRRVAGVRHADSPGPNAIPSDLSGSSHSYFNEIQLHQP